MVSQIVFYPRLLERPTGAFVFFVLLALTSLSVRNHDGAATIIQDTTRQETLLEDAAKEREDAARTMTEAAVQERENVVDSVNKQREYMHFVLTATTRPMADHGRQEQIATSEARTKPEAVRNQWEEVGAGPRDPRLEDGRIAASETTARPGADRGQRRIVESWPRTRRTRRMRLGHAYG
jgi:hypothetical protein